MDKFFKEALADYFRTNPVAKDVTDMTPDELKPIAVNIGKYVSQRVADFANHLTVADMYDGQANAKRQECVKTETVAECEVEEPKSEKTRRKPGRKPLHERCGLYRKLQDIPADIDRSLVYEIYTRQYGKRVNPLYAVLETGIPASEARNHIKTNYARFQKTNYLNVSMRCVNNLRDRIMRTDTILFDQMPSSK